MKKLISLALISAMLLMLTGCRAFSYWDGMTYNQTKRYICKELEEKYGEEFTVVKTSKTGTGYLYANCAPKSNENNVFQVEVYGYKAGWRELYDDYIEYLVGREMRAIINYTLSNYCKNYAAEVYISGLHSDDSGIRSSSEATIKKYTDALPNESCTIWIAFDKDEFGNDYNKVEMFLEEVVRNVSLTRCNIQCYYVSSDIVAQCNKNINDNHVEHNYNILTDMAVLLSKHHPKYDYYYNGNGSGLVLRDVFN